MKDNLCSIGGIVCLIAAGVLAFNGIDVWGWFLFIGLILL
jgi:hypothetical protein